MPKIKEILQSLSRPTGLPKDIKATPEEIKKWREEKKPNFIDRSSYLKLGGIGGIILAAALGLWALIKDSKVGKWISGIGTGLAVGGVGASFFPFLDDTDSHMQEDLMHGAHAALELQEEEDRRRREDDEYQQRIRDEEDRRRREDDEYQQRIRDEEDERRRRENFDLNMGVDPSDSNYGNGTGISFDEET